MAGIWFFYPDLNGFEGWMDKKNDFQWIRSQLFSKPLCVDYKVLKFGI